jgi:hypothetical protein
MDFYQSALFFDLSFQFVILGLLISVCTQFHNPYSCRPSSRRRGIAKLPVKSIIGSNKLVPESDPYKESRPQSYAFFF